MIRFLFGDNSSDFSLENERKESQLENRSLVKIMLQ